MTITAIFKNNDKAVYGYHLLELLMTDPLVKKIIVNETGKEYTAKGGRNNDY